MKIVALEEHFATDEWCEDGSLSIPAGMTWR